jgi:hypothetical protein
MAQLTINLGTVANDGTGDTLRNAFDKTNQNFTELYNTNVTLSNSIDAVANAILEETDPVFVASPAYNLTNLMISHINDAYNWGDHAAAGYILYSSVNNNIIPDISDTYDLGNSENRFKDLYLSGNSLYLGDAVITANSNVINLPAGSTIDGIEINTIIDASNTDVTGDITFSGVKIIGAGTASGDGNGYSTVELVPDNSLYNNDQYLIIDPTQPNHIHIRAGGTQDASQAELYLGGEVNYVRVADSGGIRLQNQTRNDLFYNYADPADFNTATWYESSGSYFVEYTTANTELVNVSFQFNDDNENTLRVYYNGGANNLLLTSSGSVSNLGSGVYRVSVNEAPPASPTSISQFEYTIWETRTNSLQLQSNDFTVSATDDIRITGADGFSLRNESSVEPIEIHTDYNGADHAWEFEANGNLRMPNSGELIFSSSGEAGRIIPSVSDGSGLQLQAELDFEIKVNDGQGGSNIWSFAGNDITFPDATIQTTAFTLSPTLNVLKIDDGVHEKFQALSDATGTVTHDCSSGHIFYHTSPDANWTVNLINLNLNNGYATTVTIVIVQGGTGYYPSALEIGGSAQTINWQGNSTPTPSTNRTDVVSFSIINNGGTYTVLGQLTGF